MSYSIISEEKDIERGVQALCKSCPLMRKAYEVAGLPPLRRHENSFRSLARTITGQLLSVASASAIWSRVVRLVRPFEPQFLLQLDDRRLREAGLSNAKVKTMRALAAALLAGEVDFARFEREDEALVREKLQKIHGIGPWTADIYVMFCLGRADGFACGDVALANAVMSLQGQETRPKPAELAEIARKWSPYRGVAARLLWSYYAATKNIKTSSLDQ